MSVELLLLLVLGAFAVYWYLRRAAPKKPSVPAPQLPPTASAPPAPVDPFLQQITYEKANVEAAVAAATEEHERHLLARFANDVQLKERLSQFARTNELDKALVALWEEIEHYPSWSTREDFEKWNKLQLTGVSGSQDKDIKSIEFTHGAQRFKITERTWSGTEDEPYADFSLFEDGDEVFAIRCSVDYQEYGTDYRCFDIAAFKKRGNWARVLLGYFAQILIERNKSSAEFKYFGAEEIKSRFEE